MIKGNIVKSNEHGTEGLVLALTKDGKRAKVYVLGSDGQEVWRPVDSMTVILSGDEQCWKCGGSGVFQGGGIVENGKYKGYSGDCYGCAGKGKQNDADRVRNHHYWHRERAIYDALDAIEQGKKPEPLPHPPIGDSDYIPYASPENVREWREANEREEAVTKPAKVKIRSKKKAAPVATVSDADSKLIDCKGCGTLHRDDTMCPW